MIFEEIPLLAGAADQTSDITLDDQPYTIRVLWNERFGYWSLSFYERDGEAILLNVKMVPAYPLIQRYRKLAIPGDLYFIHRAGKTTRPTYDDVGGEYGLFYYDPEDTADVVLPITPRAS